MAIEWTVGGYETLESKILGELQKISGQLGELLNGPKQPEECQHSRMEIYCPDCDKTFPRDYVKL